MADTGKIKKRRKKEKDGKSKSSKFKTGTGLKIIDDFDDIRPFERHSYVDSSKPNFDIPDIEDEPDELPQIAGIIDERPIELQALERFSTDSKWKKLTGNEGINLNFFDEGNERRSPTISPPRRRVSPSHSPPRRSTGRPSSPVTGKSGRKRAASHTPSPPRRPREPTSPPRRPREQSSPPRRSRGPTSPPRRPKEQSSPPRRSRGPTSPPRRPREQSSPPRRSRGPRSPPRRIRKQSSPPRRPREPTSPPRRSRVQSSPPRRPREPTSPPRRPREPLSPPRRPGKSSPVRSDRHQTVARRPRTSPRTPSESPPSDTDRPSSTALMSRTLDGKLAGIQSASALRDEMIDHRRREIQVFEAMSESVSGRHAKTKVRDRETGKERDFETESKAKQEEQKALKERQDQYNKWGKGLKQVADQAARVDSALHEMSKPLARYKDDEDLDVHLRNQDRDGDPMLKFMSKSRGKSSKPGYSGPPPLPNRFGIPPGYRWDGVDRSGGYEKDWFGRINTRKAIEEEAYKWSVEDL